MVRRLICRLFGHRWLPRQSAWLGNIRYDARQCDRCREREYYHPVPLWNVLTLQMLQDAADRIRREYREGPR